VEGDAHSRLTRGFRLQPEGCAPCTQRVAARCTWHCGASHVSGVAPRYNPSVTSPIPPAEPEISVRTIADLPFHVLGRFQKPVAMGRVRASQVDGVSSKELFESVRDLSLGLSALGLTKGDRVAVISESRPEWILTDLAVTAVGGITVPVYPTLSTAQARYILSDSGARIAVVSTLEQLEKVQAVRHQLSAIEAVILMEGPAEAHSPSVLSFATVRERGHARMVAEWGVAREFRDAARAVSPDDLATIIYTSGTTGEPKGVMLTHAALVANMMAGAEAIEVNEEDVALSFLPLSHAFERMVCYVYLLRGVTLIFAESLETIGRDVPIVKPTVITGVPRVYEKMHSRISQTGQSGSPAKSAIFRWAVNVGMARGRAVLSGKRPAPLLALQSTLADRLVFAKIRNAVGGRLRYLVSGSAPLGVSIAEFFHGLGLPIIEGYGLTETAPILTVNPASAPRAGTVGKAVSGVELRIAADGEILARGPNVMTGYYNKPEATADAIKDGWFHTGDIGSIDAEGYLSITDRKKDLLVTSGGKKIAPQPIENVLKQSPLISEAVVLGDRRKYAAALVVPDFAALERRLRDLGRAPQPAASGANAAAEREQLVKRPDVVALYQEIVDGLNRELSQYERIKRIAILPREFTIQSGELTPSLKVKRKVVEEKWGAEIEGVYGSES
jgi:long-chain acyl-CoA synthetase